VNVVPTTLTVSVGVGIAILRHIASAGTYDSSFQWLEHDDIATVDLTSLVDGANPRWAVVEIAPNDTAEVTSLRDIFNPALGTFTAQSVDKVRGSSPTLTVRAGAAAASPVLPSGQSGVVPLAYVYIPAGATELTPGDHIMCRPLLKSETGTLVSGGGVSVLPSEGSHDVSLNPCRAKLPTLGFDIGVSEYASDFLIDTTPSAFWTAGQAYPAGATRTPIYLFAATAPYPSGYDSGTAPREMVPGVNIGPGARVPSLPAEVADSVVNSLVVAHLTPATVEDQVHGVVEGLAVNDPLWGDGVLGPAVYLGAVVHSTSFGLDLMRQNCTGGDVFYGGSVTAMGSEIDTQNGTDSGANVGNWRFENPLSATGDEQIPNTADAGDLIVRTTVGGDPTRRSINITGPTQLVNLYDSDETSRQPASSERDIIRVCDMESASAGDFVWTHEEIAGTNDSTLTVTVVGYRDKVLASR
jgi:hypothetical protein